MTGTEVLTRWSERLFRSRWSPVALVFLAALLVRLLVLFVLTDPQNPGLGWNTDVYHHWQIAYLSKEIGFHREFLRLWDLRGMEYFWGLLHPLALTVLFHLSGTYDIIVARLLSAVAGSISVVLIFSIVRRLFGHRAGIAGMLVALLSPVGVFYDASGTYGPLGIACLLGGMWSYLNERPVWAGVLWGFAAMVRAEYWLFGLGLVVAVFVREHDGAKSGRKLAAAWAVVMVSYVLFFWWKTGNPIYPLYWNFVGNVAGVWFDGVAPASGHQMAAVWSFRALAVVLAAIAAWVFLRRASYRMPLLLGIGSTLFYSVIVGFTAFSIHFSPRFLVDRRLLLPYAFLGILVTVLLLVALPWRRVGLGLVVVTLGVSQLAWVPLVSYYEPTRSEWLTAREIAAAIVEKHDGGTVCIPQDRPELTYILTRFHGIAAENIQGQHYDPFAYFEGNLFEDWPTSRKAIRDWLDSLDIRTLAFYSSNRNYLEMIEREPQWFEFVGTTQLGHLSIFSVRAPAERDASTAGDGHLGDAQGGGAGGAAHH